MNKEFTCVKDFFMETGEKEFTEGQHYKLNDISTGEHCYCFINDTKCYHYLSEANVAEHFIPRVTDFEMVSVSVIYHTDEENYDRAMGIL